MRGSKRSMQRRSPCEGCALNTLVTGKEPRGLYLCVPDEALSALMSAYCSSYNTEHVERYHALASAKETYAASIDRRVSVEALGNTCLECMSRCGRRTEEEPHGVP